MFWGEMAINKRCDLTRGCIGTLKYAQIYFVKKEEASVSRLCGKDEQPILGLLLFAFLELQC